MDLELLSKDNKWHSSFFVAKSFDDFNKRDNMAGGMFFEYDSRNLYVRLRPTYIGENFHAEAGFVPSTGVYPGLFDFQGDANYFLYPAHPGIVSMGPEFIFKHTYLPTGESTDREYSLGYRIKFLNTSEIAISYNYIFQQLTNSFNPIDSRVYTPFLIGEQYSWHSVSGSLQTNRRKRLNLLLESTYGGFYNGSNLNLNGELNFRYQPYGNIALRFDYNNLQLPDNYGQEQLFLIGPRVDLTLTDKLFFTTFYQYNNLLDNMNLNVRFQWRYKPASDFFIVYTENYLPMGLRSKNRALVFKLTYWLNV